MVRRAYSFHSSSNIISLPADSWKPSQVIPHWTEGVWWEWSSLFSHSRRNLLYHNRTVSLLFLWFDTAARVRDEVPTVNTCGREIWRGRLRIARRRTWGWQKPTAVESKYHRAKWFCFGVFATFQCGTCHSFLVTRRMKFVARIASSWLWSDILLKWWFEKAFRSFLVYPRVLGSSSHTRKRFRTNQVSYFMIGHLNNWVVNLTGGSQGTIFRFAWSFIFTRLIVFFDQTSTQENSVCSSAQRWLLAFHCSL